MFGCWEHFFLTFPFVDSRAQATAPIECKREEFKCSTGDQCIPMTEWCDSEIDCKDASDEIACGSGSIVANRRRRARRGNL